MLVAPRHKGFDLPIYSETTPVATRLQLLDLSLWQRLETNGQSTIVRTVNIHPDRDMAQMDLVDVLERADEELGITAELCDSTVVGHIWGLIAADSETNGNLRPWNSAHEAMTPAGYSLVSEVDVIRGAFCLGQEDDSRLHRLAVESGVATYYDTRRSGAQLADMDVNQFVSGVSATTGEEGVWLVDIEPRFSA